MTLTNFINRLFPITYFDEWLNDETYPIKKLEELNHPYTLVGIYLEDGSLIAVDTNDLRQGEYIENNAATKYVLDASIFPRRMKVSHNHSAMNVFFARPHEKIDFENFDIRQRFTINVFKNNGIIQGAPNNNIIAPIQIVVAFNEIEKQFYSSDKSQFDSQDIGSLFMEVDFHRTEPTYRVKIKSQGFSYSEIENTIKAIKKNTIN